MAKFKVGDRVQVVDDRGGAKLGETGEIIGIDTTLSTAFYYIKWDAGGRKQGLYENRLALLPAFKVGDRVQIIVDSLPWYRTGEIAEVIRADGGDNDCYVRFDTHRMAGDCWYAKWDHLKPVSFKIEAGKYYRTRDGRKVGPVRSEGLYWGAPEVNDSYYDDGRQWRAYESHHDLIAEWVDEPVKAAAPFPFILRNLEFTVAPIAKPAIVALIENGQPKPSVAPFVHANETLAAKEAARLANLHKGKEFGVYVLTQKVSESAPSYKHEWQRFAAKGEKLSAIKELRSVTGLGLKSAKDAVEHWIAHDEPYSRIAA
ncbi:ribosomal protein L7/L12 [Brucella pituitosa]|uniref:ribosomal protein L7/L12 n=1 Tax=Brucella pituitosa TaxID=571256 RepID=UPI003F4AF24E